MNQRFISGFDDFTFLLFWQFLPIVVAFAGCHQWHVQPAPAQTEGNREYAPYPQMVLVELFIIYPVDFVLRNNADLTVFTFPENWRLSGNSRGL